MIEFTATEIGYLEEEEYETLSCGASNADSSEPYHYINFQRAIEIEKDDDGVYFEIDDQINGGYNIIEHCELRENQLIVRLKSEFKEKPSEIIVVKFSSLATEGLLPINHGLSKVFKGQEERFTNHHA